MIRIGFSRWFVSAKRVPMNRGEVKLEIILTPQAKKYRVSAVKWAGLHRSITNETVSPQIFTQFEVHQRYELKAALEVMSWRRLANQVASDTVRHCLTLNVVSFEAVDLAGAIYAVEGAIMRVVESGVCDQDPQMEELDLVPDMEAMRNDLFEQERLRREEAMRRDAAQIHDFEQHQKLGKKERADALGTSMQLLYERLTPEEIEHVTAKGFLKVTNLLGDFHIPIKTHGFVEQYVGGKYAASYCIVFEDPRIPVGDEVLMKKLLLKADPQKFLKTAMKTVAR